MLDQLSYFYESCPHHRYSTNKGYLDYKLNHRVYDYFTLMINGSAPNSNFHGKYTYHDITCRDCPYGGNCDEQIRSLPNFWGYEIDGVIHFSQCPKGYCCSAAFCPSYNTCANHRTGVLCSKCEHGYSEALFSSKCVPDEECGPIWIWPFSAGMGILYMLFVFFQKDVRDFIFTRPTECDNLACCKRKTEEVEYRMCDRTPEAPAMYENKLGEEFVDIREQNGIQMPEDKPDAKHDHENNITSVSRSHNNKTNGNVVIDEGQGSPTVDEPPPPPGIYLIIIMYYFQDAQLFHVKTASSTPESPTQAMIKALLLGLFKFRLEVAQFVNNVCLMPGLSPSVKLLAKSLLVPYVLLIFAALYICYQMFAGIGIVKRPKEGEGKTFLS